MQELLEQITAHFSSVQLNPGKPYEEVQMRGKTTRAARVIVNGIIVDILDQDDVISVWVNSVGSKKQTTVRGAFEFLTRQINN